MSPGHSISPFRAETLPVETGYTGGSLEPPSDVVLYLVTALPLSSQSPQSPQSPPLTPPPRPPPPLPLRVSV